MKLFSIKCDQGNEDINIITVSKRFENFTIGSIECEKGHVQKRYLSEADIMIYFGFSAIIYTLAYLAIIYSFVYTGVNLINIILIALMFVALFFLLKFVCKYIYVNAPFKKELKDFTFEEDEKAVSRRTKWQFIMFMLVAFMLGVNPDFTGYLIFLLLAFIIITFIKIRFLVRNERRIFASAENK